MDPEISDNTTESVNKKIQLQILEDLVKATDEMVEQKNYILKEEIKTLDNIHERVWTLQNEMCDRIWEFSRKHEIIFNFSSKNSNYIKKGPPDTENIRNHAIHELETRNVLADINEQETNSKIKTQENSFTAGEKMNYDENIFESNYNLDQMTIFNTGWKKIAPNNFLNENKTYSSNNTTQNISNSKISTTHNFDWSSSKLLVSKNFNSLKKKSVEIKGSDFVRASDLFQSKKPKLQFNNVPTKETIISEAQSTDGNLSASKILDQPQTKRFVFKTKSIITQRKMDKLIFQ